jgi:hypothetical protein
VSAPGPAAAGSPPWAEPPVARSLLPAAGRAVAGPAETPAGWLAPAAEPPAASRPSLPEPPAASRPSLPEPPVAWSSPPAEPPAADLAEPPLPPPEPPRAGPPAPAQPPPAGPPSPPPEPPPAGPPSPAEPPRAGLPSPAGPPPAGRACPAKSPVDGVSEGPFASPTHPPRSTRGPGRPASCYHSCRDQSGRGDVPGQQAEPRSHPTPLQVLGSRSRHPATDGGSRHRPRCLSTGRRGPRRICVRGPLS